MPVGGDDETVAASTGLTLPGSAGSAVPDNAVVAGRYRIVRWLGGGGMGRVYEALDEELGERVALKMLRAGLTEDAIERFRREVKLTRRIQHRNVARMFDIGDHAGEKFLTMELVDGEPLSRALGDRMPWPRLADLAAQICAGLAAAHAAGVVHRDLKPDNVLVEGSTNRAVITDFGIARSSEDGSVTQHGAIIGTPRYMAPEQLAGREVDARADLFSLGVMLYELASGARPWAGDNAIAIAVAQATQPPRPLAAPHAPAAFAQLVMRCLALDPAGRPASAADIGTAIAFGTVMPAGEPRPSGRVTVPYAPSPTLTPVNAGPLDDAPAQATAVAVLPVTCAPGDEYLADGLCDDLIDTLSSAGNLRVRPAGFVRSRGEPRDPREVGRELAVDHVVAAGLRRTPVGLRVSARLISVADGFQIWAHRADCQEAEILAVADQLGAGIASALSTRAVAQTKPTDPRAVDLYLRARAELRRFWASHVRAATELLEEAAKFAPTSPQIISALAYAQAQAWLMEGDPPLLPIAQRAVARALPTGHGEAFLASAILEINQGHLEAGASALGTAVVRAPMSAQAHEQAGRLLLELDAVDLGKQHLATALGFDPGRAHVINADLARMEALDGNWDAALPRVAAITSDPDLSVAQLGAVFAARFAGWRRDIPAMIATADRFTASPMRGAFRLLAFIRSVMQVRRVDPVAWQQVAQMFGGDQRPQRIQALGFQLMAEMAAILDENDLAVDSLHRAVGRGLLDIAWLDRCPVFEAQRRDLRWLALRDEVAARASRMLAAFRAA
ncbi:MAG TPA: serine/threonine-protein kinase [Kofleriaceae bacterium]|jgi:serine/threonine-protein kinase